MAEAVIARLAQRVYYEDTDAGKVVYYANYLKFLERGRTELLRTLGFEQQQLADDCAIVFAVRSLSVEFLQPARLDDMLNIDTQIEELRRAQVIFAQSIHRNNITLLTAKVRVACVDQQKGKAVAIPALIRESLMECQ